MDSSKAFKAFPCLLAAALAGCSGMGTTLSRIGRMDKNRGYEIHAREQTVQQAATAVLTARGYDVSVKPDPDNGAEGAGLIVIGQRKASYSGVPVEGRMGEQPPQVDTRDLVDVYLSKKWQMGNDEAVAGITLVDIVGGAYVRKEPGADEVETPLSGDATAALRDDIERHVDAIHADKAAAE